METKQNLTRGQFMKQLGLSSKALMAFYCLGAVSACSKEDDPNPVNNNNNNNNNTNTGLTGTTTGTSINFTLDLTNATYSKLLTEGEFLIIGDVIVANAKGNYVALSKACTHQGTTIQYRKDNNDFRCPNHGSEFALSGTVTKSPAVDSLKTFTATLATDKKSLKVS